ncbi:MAG: c-type cytochrome [Planctomycetota bacterium]|nr:c-type cytochrome [Planctomycetota bacterium]
MDPSCSVGGRLNEAWALVLLGLVLAIPAHAQNGDAKGEVQPDLPADLVVPPAPALSAEDELATFTLAPGLRVELVAADPLINDPITAEFDERGRLWVVEMLGYMPNVDGTGEAEPIGKIAILSDEDGDGRMDTRVEFMKDLVLPRSVHPCLDGALVILPGQVLFCRDEDGDGAADSIEVIDTFNGGIASPEHSLNGFERTLDNWYRCANGGVKYRLRAGRWERGQTTGGGQWGITKDDLGRIMFNGNSDPLRGDLFPSAYSLRNPSLGKLAGMNRRFAHDFTTWPVRITPGVNRGYRPATLRDDFTLNRVTGTCGPHIYRGTGLGEGFNGDAFVPEPCGNLVKRYRMVSKGGLGLDAKLAYQGREFIASTDERFRPVNAFGGPDGGLYLVDLYRGILQHRLFVTTFLRKQILARGLDKPLGLGRIWRIVNEDHEAPEASDLSQWSWSELVAALASPNGWLRDTAQRILVEEWEGAPFVEDLLIDLAQESPQALGRLHALWTLAGVGSVDRDLILAAIADPDPRVATAAVRVGEEYLSTGRKEIVGAVEALAMRTDDARLRHQCVLSLGAVQTSVGDDAIARILTTDCSTAEIQTAAISGLYTREAAFVATLLADPEWAEEKSGRAGLLKQLARCVVRQGTAGPIEALLRLSSEQGAAQGWRARALCAGLLAGRSKGPKGDLRPVMVTSEPKGLDALAAVLGSGGPATLEAIGWPGKPGLPEDLVIRPMTPEEQGRFARGALVFRDLCSTCHQASGRGQAGMAPPLRGSEWVFGSEKRLVLILAHGLHGPIRVDGTQWDMEMPAFAGSPEEIASILTYIRREWGHGADPVAPDSVERILDESGARAEAWTAEELLKLR